jgi:hypothetical protein
LDKGIAEEFERHGVQSTEVVARIDLVAANVQRATLLERVVVKRVIIQVRCSVDESLPFVGNLDRIHSVGAGSW